MQSPLEGESPLALLRVQVVACTDLLAKDRNGFSDPFATISLPPHPTRHSTPVSKRTLNPTFPAAQSTFDFPIYLSLADRLGVLEVVVWDKDYFGVEKIGMGRKEYLGEVGISLEDWFSIREPGEQLRALGWFEEGNTTFSLSLASTRSNTNAQGSVQLKIGFVEAPKHQAHHQRFSLAKETVGAAREGIEGLLGKEEKYPDVEVDFEEVYGELLKRSRPSLVNIPPTEGVGTVRSHATVSARPEDNSNFIDLSNLDTTNEFPNGYQNGYQAGYPYEDDGGLSSSEEDEVDDADGVRSGDDFIVRNAQYQSEPEEDHSESDSSSCYSNSDAEISEEDEEGSQSETSGSEDGEDPEEGDARTPTLPTELSPMTTPTASNTGAYALNASHTPEPPISFSALYTPPASAPAFSQSNSFEVTTSPAGKESSLDATSPIQAQSMRNPPPPALDLTPVSPDGILAKSDSVTPTTGSAYPSASTVASPRSPVSKFRLSPTRAATFSGSTGVRLGTETPSSFLSQDPVPTAPKSAGLSSILPRIPKPKFPSRRSTSANITSPPSSQGPVYDLTEDVPRLPLSAASTSGAHPTRPNVLSSSPNESANGNITDPGELEQNSAKKSRFRKSWSGVRVPTRPRRSLSMDSPVSSSSASPFSGTTSSPGSTLGSPPQGEAIEPTVNQDAATQTAMGKKVKKPGKATKKDKGKAKEKGKVKEKKEIKKDSTKTKKEKTKASASGEKSKVRRKGEGKRRKRPAYSFGGGESNDIVGIVMLEIQKAEDLPKLKNMTRTGWDMDPFIVVSFGKKVFRTRVIRHSLNPSFDEKLLFHVRRYETNFKVHLTVLDWDKLSSNDYIGECDFDVSELIAAFEDGRGVDPETGLYPLDDGQGSGSSGMKEFKLPVRTAKEMPWEAKYHPFISLRGKYQPYAALRQRFWLQYLKQYDTDDTGMLSHLELTSMLDSLGSTLTNATIKSFFTRFNKDPWQEELTMAETIQCLETELGRPESQKKRLGADDGGYESSVSATPVMMLADRRGKELSLEQLDFSGPPLSAMISPGLPDAEFLESDRVPAPKAYAMENGAQQPLTQAAAGREGAETNASSSSATTPSGEYDAYYGSSSYLSSDADMDGLMEYPKNGSNVKEVVSRPAVSSSSTVPSGTAAQLPSSSVTFALAPPPSSIAFSHSYSSSTSGTAPPTTSAATNPNLDSAVERVINVQTCPLCHRPRLNAKAEVDIVTHLAICASQDWNKVDRIVVGNFVTASQAQRKWYTRIIGKMSSGNYKLGANSANIIVQNRSTGQLEEEKMQVYVRLGIRLLYKGMKSRMEGSRARRLLKSLSIKQGVKYDSPESVRDILPFIQFHKLDMNEVRDPVKSFKTFNQFFYRKLKPDARPVDSPSDPYRMVSAADCRFMAFESVSEATRLWIKGREFSVARLLGNAYKAEAERYNGGALAIFRLAPQDYHRFHSPVDGRIGNMTYIAGEYYTVNPQAIRTALDVYGENARKIVPIDSPQFGRVMAVCVGAMMVGTIQTTVEEGQWVKRGEEFGYFAFGGSTIVLLFEPGVLEWDEDLVINGRAALETLVRVGMGLGTGLRKGIS
ncbi:phosphatidylserine decarboxylase [Lentinula edodes]|uniref:Phosphatidylserine decarboxylase proenzyme 2 n=1 Tax=Lentinula edodes TaxID=5353 RepID=A0A1Q3ETG6_LENED|nr:phosphatidylserine decarboxylase [Lentinula edodes]